jgi:hypothetical protein
MYVYDHGHRRAPVSVHSPAELIAHLRSTRKGIYGAFILCHDETGPSLFIQINNDLAYLHFFPDDQGRHPGFQPTGMSPADCPESVYLMQDDGFEANGDTMPGYALVSVDVAYRAAAEFLHEPVLPPSISWFEL